MGLIGPQCERDHHHQGEHGVRYPADEPNLDPREESVVSETAAEPTTPIRVVVAKPGLDGHDRGAKVVARALRDAGVEVVYTGLHQTPEQIVDAAVQEDADAIGLSVLSGAHLTLFPRVVELLAERKASDIVVFGGGIIPDDDIPVLEAAGVAKVFTPGTPMYDIVEWVKTTLAR
jgi:methylmalonyl-CoA mutase C-terminal domain/subunit